MFTHQRHSLYLTRDIQRKTGVFLFLYPDTDKTASQRTVSVREKDYFHAQTESEWCHLSPLIYEGQKNLSEKDVQTPRFLSPLISVGQRNFESVKRTKKEGIFTLRPKIPLLECPFR